MVDHKNGTYEFVYVIPREGDFSLALRLYDQHIKGSPFKLKVSRLPQVEVSKEAEQCRQHRRLGQSQLTPTVFGSAS